MTKFNAAKFKSVVTAITRGLLTLTQVIDEEEKSIMEKKGKDLATMKKVRVKTRDKEIVTGVVTKVGAGYIELVLDETQKRRRINPKAIDYVEEAE